LNAFGHVVTSFKCLISPYALQYRLSILSRSALSFFVMVTAQES
jgi:hypothetical protein